MENLTIVEDNGKYFVYGDDSDLGVYDTREEAEQAIKTGDF